MADTKKEYRKIYVNVKTEHLNPETNIYSLDQYVEDLGELKITFRIDPENEWKSGEGNYGPWTLCGNISVSPYIDDKGLFAQYDWDTKTKIVGRGTKIKDGAYLSIYKNEKDDKDSVPYKLYFKVVKNDDPF